MKKVELLPTAKLAVNKSLLKQYVANGESVYFLEDGDEFQIELFNPTQDTIMARIGFNGGDFPSEGLVLYPGQRIFLDRYLDNNKKMRFSTYMVEDTNEVKHAIKQNGLVEVRFYREQKLVSYPQSWGDHTITICPPEPNWMNPSIFYYDGSSTGGFAYGTTTGEVTLDSTSVTNCVNLDNASFTSTASMDFDLSNDIINNSEIETGRIGQGQKSKQEFVNTYENFCTTAFHEEEFKILPNSSRVMTADSFKHRKYCSQCGKKVKKNDKFCSNCGVKL